MLDLVALFPRYHSVLHQAVARVTQKYVLLLMDLIAIVLI